MTTAATGEMLRLSKRYKTTVTIDGFELRISVKKLTKAEDLDFMLSWEELGREVAARQEELARFRRQYTARLRDEGVSDDVIAKMKPLQFEGALEASLSEADREARRKRNREVDARDADFLVNSVGAYIGVEPGQIFDEDEERQITEGRDLVAHFESRRDVLQRLLGVIYAENHIGEEQKKTFSSLFASALSSSTSSTGPGPIPVAIAAPADDSDIARIERAAADRAMSPSGETASSSATDVQS